MDEVGWGGHTGLFCGWVESLRGRGVSWELHWVARWDSHRPPDWTYEFVVVCCDEIVSYVTERIQVLSKRVREVHVPVVGLAREMIDAPHQNCPTT
jgi:hypothetical protein